MRKIKKTKEKHGFTGTRIYNTWKNMIARCYNDSTINYNIYGGRGIIVCDDWKHSFVNFFNDIGESYQDHVEKFGYKNTTIDRIDVNGNYCKENCRWATRKEQGNNRNSNVIIKFNGESMNIQEWSVKLNMKYSTINNRIHRGWQLEKALTNKLYKSQTNS